MRLSKMKTYVMALAVAAFGATSVAFARQEGSASPALEKYSYVIVLGNDTTFELTDSLFYSISRKVIFPVNKYDIPRNSEFRRTLLRELRPYMADSSHVLDKVYVRGAASPEGPLHWNEFLAEHRAKALTELIAENSFIDPERKPRTLLVPEDYIYLLLLLKERNDKDYDIVADMVNRWIGSDQQTLKQELQDYDDGRLWRRLLRDYFPQMRAARLVVVFRKVPRYEWMDLQPPVAAELQGELAALPRPPQVPVNPVLQRRREVLSVKTNLLFDAAATPNVAIEYYPLRGHFTFGASLDCPWWQNYGEQRYWQIRNYQLEARYYLKSGDMLQHGYGNGPAFRGWYLQAYAHAGLYSICFDANSGYEGEGVGAGLGAGYVLPLGKKSRWRMEFGLQVGFFRTWYDPYQWLCPVDPTEGGDLYYYKWTGKPEDFKERQHRFTWLGPTRIGITLTYDLLYRKRDRRGMSFRSWEWK